MLSCYFVLGILDKTNKNAVVVFLFSAAGTLFVCFFNDGEQKTE